MNIKKYIIAIVFTDEGWISLKNYLQRQKNRCDQQEEPLFIHVIIGKVTEEKIICRGQSSPVQWTNIDQWTPDCVQLFEQINQSSETSTREDDISEVLHSISDTLPYTGCLVDAFCELPEATTSADGRSDNHLRLFGALRRLKDWHNAQIINVHITTDFMQSYHGDTSQRDDLLSSLLGAKTVGCFEDLNTVDECLLWRGKVSMIDKMVNRGFLFSGFSLKFKGKRTPRKTKTNVSSLVPGRMLEVLDEVDVRTIPVYMLTTLQYKLSLYDARPQSQAFMDILQGNSQTGLVTRMACYDPTTDIPECGARYLNTSTWKESIIADVTFVQEPEEELLDNHGFLYLLITLPDPVFDGTCHSNLIATRLHPPKELNGGFISSLCERTNEMAKTVKLGGNDVPFDLSTLPYFDKYIINDIHQMLSNIEDKLLTEWLAIRRKNGEPTTVKADEVKKFLSEIQEIFLCNLELSNFETQKEDITVSAQGCKSEVDLDPSDWAERKLLIYRESQKHTLSRLQSTDSVAMSSPLQISNDPATTLDVKDLLKLFREDATAVADDLSPVRKRHPSRCKKTVVPASHDLDTEVIPNYLDSCYHDSYYNRDRKTEKFESHNNKLRDRCIVEETVSVGSSTVFNLPQKQRKTDTKSVTPRGRSAETSLKSQHGRRELKSTKLKSPLKSPRKMASLRKSPRKSVMGRSNQILSVRRSPRKCVTSSMEVQSLAQELSRKPHLLNEKHRRHSLSSQVIKKPGESDVRSKRKSVSGSLSEMNKGASRNEEAGDRRKSLDGTARVSRSERHRRRLEDIVKDVLTKNGVEENSDIYKPCADKLFKVTKLFVMDLPTSENLKQEMRRIAEGQVQQVVDMETRKRQTGIKGQSQPG